MECKFDISNENVYYWEASQSRCSCKAITEVQTHKEMKLDHVLLLKYILKDNLPMPSHATEDKRKCQSIHNKRKKSQSSKRLM